VIFLESGRVGEPAFQAEQPKPRLTLHDVLDFNILLFLAEIFYDQSAVAMIGLLFATKRATSVNDISLQFSFDFTLRHEFEKLLFVRRPATLGLAVSIQHIPCRCQLLHCCGKASPFI